MMSRKRLRISSAILVLIALFFLCMPTYMREALIHWYPDISDTYLFASHTIEKPDTCWEWPVAPDCNTYVLDSADNAYLDELKTVAFLVIQNDSICMRNTGKTGLLKPYRIFFPRRKVLWGC